MRVCAVESLDHERGQMISRRPFLDEAKGIAFGDVVARARRIKNKARRDAFVMANCPTKVCRLVDLGRRVLVGCVPTHVRHIILDDSAVWRLGDMIRQKRSFEGVRHVRVVGVIAPCAFAHSAWTVGVACPYRKEIAATDAA